MCAVPQLELTMRARGTQFLQDCAQFCLVLRHHGVTKPDNMRQFLRLAKQIPPGWVGGVDRAILLDDEHHV